MSEVQGLQTIVHLVAATRDRLFYAQNLIESCMGCSEEGGIREAWQQLVDGQYPENIVQMTRLQYENILATDMNELRYELVKKAAEAQLMARTEAEEMKREAITDMDSETGAEHEHAIWKLPERAGRSEESIQKLLDDVDHMIGLTKVKTHIHRQVANIRFNRERGKHGMQPMPQTLHMVFTGNPGTGKTTVARMIGKIYKELGLLTKGQFIEVDRSMLVAGFIGQSEEKTTELLKSALGGVLFIDEAYALLPEGTVQDKDFGSRVVETLLKFMEDHRENIVIIAAGYVDEMNRFISGNPGLKSRFTNFIHFDDYSGDELYAICRQKLAEKQFVPAGEAEARLKEFFDDVSRLPQRNLGNGRFSRIVAENISMQMACRLYGANAEPAITEEDLTTVTVEDAENAIRDVTDSFIAQEKEMRPNESDQ